MPPVGLTNPGLWNPRNDEWDRYLTDEKKHATRDEYRHLLCYGVFTAAAHAALTAAVATLRANNATARDTADANDLLDSAIRTIATCGQAAEDRLTYLRRFKCKKALTGEERVAERLVYSRFFDTTAAEGSINGVDGLLNAMDDKRLEVSLHQAAKAQAAAQFKGSGSGGSGGGSGNIRIKEQERASEHVDRATKERADKNKDKDKIKGKPQPGNPARKTTIPQTEEQNWRMQDATPAQLTFLEGELARFVESGAWELGTCRKWVSRLFLVPKPGVNQWRCTIDLRVLNSYCVRKRLKMETLLGVRHLTKKGEYLFSFDLQDGLYALGIAEADRDYYSPWTSEPTRSKRYLRRTGWRGARILPYVDDFLLFSASMEHALHLRQRLASLLDALGLQRNPTKGFWEPCQFGRHLGVDIDSASGVLRTGGQAEPALPAGHPAHRPRHAERQVAPSARAAVTGMAGAVPLSGDPGRKILPAGAPLRVVGDRWGGRIRMTPQLRRDLHWWTSVPSQSSGKPIHRPVETAYLHTDSSDYGWGGVLNGRLEAWGFWSSADERQHITWKDLKAVRLAVESFLPHLAGRNVLLHEDNQAVCHILSGLTSRSPEMMAELRRLWCLLDSHGIHLRARYFRSAANIWADRLISRHLDSDDWQLDPLLFAELESRFGPHSIDRFASALNTLLPRYNAAWLDPTCKAVDSLHLPDADWRRENNWCNAPWPLLPDLVQKLQQSGAAATVVAPRWEGKAWHQALTEMAVEELTVAPRAGLFRPGRRDARAAWAPTTAAFYASCMKQYFRFCEEERRPALAADPETMVRYVTWLGNLGTIKASSLQPYLSAVNNFFKDHVREPMALGDLVSRVRKGLAASQVTLNPELMRAPLPARVVLKALTLAKALRLELGPTWGTDPSTVVRVELFRASLAVVVFAGGRVLAARWAISQHEGQAKWTADTLTGWLQLGATTAAYVIGVTMQKIKYFGGWLGDGVQRASS
eukprot:jgi/Tetstr1/421591/TSEL_012535.t1